MVVSPEKRHEARHYRVCPMNQRGEVTANVEFAWPVANSRHSGVWILFRVLENGAKRRALECVMKRSLILIAASLFALPAVSSTPKMSDAERVEKALVGRSAGKPQSCVQLRDLGSSEVIGDDIFYRSSRKLLYRNQTSGGCGHRGYGDALITRTYSSNLCRGDVVRTADLHSGFETGFCILGDFVPYKKADPEG
jgi:hypothetical protein